MKLRLTTGNFSDESSSVATNSQKPTTADVDKSATPVNGPEVIRVDAESLQTPTQPGPSSPSVDDVGTLPGDDTTATTGGSLTSNSPPTPSSAQAPDSAHATAPKQQAASSSTPTPKDTDVTTPQDISMMDDNEPTTSIGASVSAEAAFTLAVGSISEASAGSMTMSSNDGDMGAMPEDGSQGKESFHPSICPY